MVIDLFLYKNVGMIWKGEGIVFAGKKDANGFIFFRFPAFSFVEFRKGFSVDVCVEGDRWPVEGIDIIPNDSMMAGSGIKRSALFGKVRTFARSNV